MNRNNRSKALRKDAQKINFFRKVNLYFARFILLFKLSLLVFLGAFFFTDYLNFIKDHVREKWYDFSAEYMGLRLENVIIEGQKYTPSKYIISCIDADVGTPILSINLDSIKDKIEESSWVKMAIVERKLPSKLYIGVVERKPIALWQYQNMVVLVDAEGSKIVPSNLKPFKHLLLVVGSDAHIYAKSLIDNLATAPDLARQVESAVRYGERRWDIKFKDGLLAKMPEENFAKAWGYLVDLHKKNKLFKQNIKSIDMRNSEKYYVVRD